MKINKSWVVTSEPSQEEDGIIYTDLVNAWNQPVLIKLVNAAPVNSGPISVSPAIERKTFFEFEFAE